MKSLYETLEISENASADEIKKSYRRLARKYHPDINKDSGAEDKFKEINAAYEILSDPNKKAQYDAHGDSMFGGQNFSDYARAHDVNFDDILSEIFGGGFQKNGFSGGFSGFGGFNGGFNGRRDLESSINIPLRVAVLGGKERITTHNGSFTIAIPAGIKNGDIIRARGKGDRGGDLLLKVSTLSDSEYTREGDSLTKKVNIPLKTALFGGSIEVETLYKTIKLKVPKNTKNNQKFRAKELGAKNRKTSTMGDLYLIANVILPDVDSLDEELSKSLQEKLQGA